MVSSTLGCQKEDPFLLAENFGEITSAVIIVNPEINEGSTTTVTSGTVRGGIKINSGNKDATTDATGLAVLKGLPTGEVFLDFDIGSVSINVIKDKELYDVVVAYKDDVMEIVEEVRYPIGGEVIRFSPEDDLSQAFNTSNAIIVLEEGIYDGNYNITAENVLVFGAWDESDGAKSSFSGDLLVSGPAGNKVAWRK